MRGRSFLGVAAAVAVFAGIARAGEIDPGERLAVIEQAMSARDKTIAPRLREWAANDASERIRERSIGALTLLGDPGASGLLLRSLSGDPSPRVRRAAAEAAGILKLPALEPRLAESLAGDLDPFVRAECARAIGRVGIRTGGAALLAALVTDPSPEVRALCAEALSSLRTPGAQEILRPVARSDSSTLVRIYAIRALAEIDAAGSASLFESVWKDSSDLDLRAEAFRGLLRSGKGGSWEEAGLSDVDPRIRFLSLQSWIARTLPQRGARSAGHASAPVARLERFLSDPVPGIRDLAREALEREGYSVRPSGFGYVLDRK